MTLVSLADRAEDVKAWLSARRRVVTASDLVHLMDAADKHWRKTPEQLAIEKRTSGGLSSTAARCGSFWEPRILEFMDAVVGLETEPESRLIQDPNFPFLACSPDAWLGTGLGWGIAGPPMGLEDVLTLYTEEDILYGQEAVEGLREALAKSPVLPADDAYALGTYRRTMFNGLPEYAAPSTLVEVKNQPSKKRSLWTKPGRPPRYYEVQCQSQMAVIPVDLVLLTARVDSSELHVHLVRRDELQVDLIREVASDFYNEYLKEG